MYSQQTVHSSETSIINLHLSVKKTDWKVAAMKISHDSTCTVTVSAERLDITYHHLAPGCCSYCLDWWLVAGEAAGDCGNFIHPPSWQTHCIIVLVTFLDSLQYYMRKIMNNIC